jgi:hypothetical protein
MSEAEAYLRIHAARVSRQYPRIVRLLEQGALHFTAIRLLSPCLTPENHEQLLERASGKRKREIELLVAAIAPKPDIPDRTRKLPEPSSRATTRPSAKAASPSGETKQPALSLAAAVTASASDASKAPTAAADVRYSNQPPATDVRDPNPTTFVLEAPRQRGSCKPLSPGRYKVEFMAGQA